MTTPPSSPSAAALTSRLRAAGCVFAEDEARLLLSVPQSDADLEAMIAQRVAGFPLEAILGWVVFCGLRIGVGPGVFVPRQRTEFLVREAARLSRPGAVVLDLGSGTGALGVALGSMVDGIELHSTDIDTPAVACTRRNTEPLGGRVYQGDLFAPLPPELRGRIDIMLANVPYVPTDAIDLLPPEARDHEPLVTLDGGLDGLEVLRRVAAEATDWLAPGGSLLIEIGDKQRAAATDAVTAGGLTARVVDSEEFYATVVIAQKSPRPVVEAREIA
ncbi:putative protein N(5)-glutamine methyltransferase [Glaciibacter psychrotolerans]|uniref:peptide chain release factor N(5)-glutamine methyltransferase n=1 Tax=Glaciibacter psychrotolerans TaxID=670054 RepID=A0A7Z0ECL3_9MICO|nr:putative protein N(5)-glutamine methyltransferase [Leifsonia psychrotolerans]NYJ18700.1 release factor glutamine methyltransferase [Leifsonia psychrotolerans]